MLGYDIVLLDVEGTTTPISFVHEVLFPYILDNVDQFLKAKWRDPVVQEHVRAIADQTNKDAQAGIVHATPIDLDADTPEVIRQKVAANVNWQMKADRKIAALKGLQGYMWRFGYASGQLQGVMFDDAVEAIKRWSTDCKVFIYSSGSVEAQKLIFGYSDHGDLLPYISGHYDTNIGSKQESQSYTKIAEDIGVLPKRILFISDNENEIYAADQAGFQTVVSVRPGNPLLTEATKKNYKLTSDFMELL
ncbi:enolase-phosphatase E1 [Coemansia interrupta]|uniref:Enolase-phosphatase E1 n=1 Tax=Coemansia interrupta TaxID=1126814 RepID=A0A9W8LK71_9FUNG|nr:enolase-phosphatase E1 [Coemansia interrupta]